MGPKIHTVFISATKKDLEEHRKVLIETLERSDHLKCLTMERFGPQSNPPLQQCLDKVQQSEFFVGIIGHYRGWQPEDDEKQRSITEIEYDHAVSLNKIVLMVVLPDDQLTLKPELREPDDAWERQCQFRDRIKSDFVVEVVSTDPKDIAIAVQTSVFSIMLSNTIERKDREKGQPEVPPEIKKEQKEAFEAAIEQHFIDPEKILSGGQEFDDEALIEQFWQQAERSTEKAVEYYKYVGALAFHNHTQKAFEAYSRVVELAPDDPEGWNMIGVIQSINKLFDEAQSSFDKALDLAKQKNDKPLVGYILGNIAILFSMTKDLDKANRIFSELEAYYFDKNDNKNLALVYLNHMKTQIARKNWKLAKNMYLKASTIFMKLRDEYNFALVNLNYVEVLCNSYDEQNKNDFLKEALVICEQANTILKKFNDYHNLAIARLYLGNIENHLSNVEKARSFWRESLLIFKMLDDQVMVKNIEDLLHSEH